MTSREEIAKREAGHTDISPPLSRILVLVFLLTLMSVPLVQYMDELRLLKLGERHTALPQSMNALWIPIDGFSAFRSATGGPISRVYAANREALRSIHDFEEDLEEGSVVGAWLRPRIQTFLTGALGAGNEQVYCGRDGWLFYRPAVDHLTMRGFLEDRELTRRGESGNEWQEPPQPNPLIAILEFRDQLARRGIELIVVPIPVKAAIHPEFLSSRFVNAPEPIYNPSFLRLLSDLADHEVRVYDPTPLLWKKRSTSGEMQYLSTDTHWTPQAMDLVATDVAEMARGILGPPETDDEIAEHDREANRVGDLAEMLEMVSVFPSQTVQIKTIYDARRPPTRPEESTDILLLGDSFANIYSQEALGWGADAGFAQRLSYHAKRPVTALIRHDDGAFATRLLLSQKLADGHDVLADTRVVIWEFTSRELSFGDWRPVEMEDPTTAPADFFVPPPGNSIVIEGTIAAIAKAPDPRTAPYADYIIGLHLVDLRADLDLDGNQALVFTWAMRNRNLSAAAGYRIGQRVSLELNPWADFAPQLESVARGEIYDDHLLFQTPCWGQEVTP